MFRKTFKVPDKKVVCKCGRKFTKTHPNQKLCYLCKRGSDQTKPETKG